jgi:DNA-binding CsgD family transcriptional regulator
MGIVSRPDEQQAVAEFLDSAAREPSALVIEGSAGTGKTTMCLQAVERAQERRMRVLTTRPAIAESVVAYTALADLIGGVDAGLLAGLPEPQLKAVDHVLLRVDEASPATEPRAVAAAFLSIIDALTDQTPVLVAIDDAQWLDPSSVFALDYAARRLTGRIGVLATVRTGSGSDGAVSWLHVRDPVARRRITVPPFSIGEISQLLSDRIGLPFSRSDIVRMHEVSGGNPFYALELARSLADADPDKRMSLPHTLSELVQARISGLGAETRHTLLAAACLAAPTVDVLARAMSITPHQLVDRIEPAETEDIVEIDGNSVRFTHPLLATGVYTNASAASRRQMHRRLAGAVDQHELRARHLALSVTIADDETLNALDEAAEMARRRGAPAAAAELLDLAINLGGDDVQRQVRSAGYRFEGGDAAGARSLLGAAMKRLSPGHMRAAAANLLATIVMYADGFGSAATILEGSLVDATGDAALNIQMLMSLAYMLMNTGQKRESVQRVDEAVGHAERLGQPTLLRRALGLRVVLKFMCGEGVDDAGVKRALKLEDDQSPAPLAFQPRMQHAILMAWTGELDYAREELRSIERRRIENGEESESHFISYHRAMVEIWCGDFAEANRIAGAAIDRAAHLDGDVALFSAVAIRSSLAAYAGRVEEARRDARVALEASDRSEGRELGGWLLANLGLLEVSLGNYEAAMATLRPIVDGLFADPDYSEIIVASAVPDAVEAMVHLDRLDEADRLTDLIERNGRRLDRAWMRGVAGRARAQLLAARGDINGAVQEAEEAMEQHARVPMPFERARTQLLLGQLQRRQRRKQVASVSLQEALDSFERLNTPLWADRARADLARITVTPSLAVLTASERRVAELAASGMTNRAIAAELFISPKTVDTTLMRMYRKLGIHSRAELARWASDNLR